VSTYSRVVAADETASLAPAVRARLAVEIADSTSDIGGALSTKFEMRSVLDVRSFGAVGDWNGTTGSDNLAAFNAALAAIGTTGYARIVVPPGDYWLSNSWTLDGEDVELEIMTGATIRTTSATSLGHAVAFLGHGVLAVNTDPTPQRHRFRAFGGGTIVALNALDNALGVVRVKNASVEGLTLTSGQHAATAQYGVDNLTMERLEVTAGASGCHTYGSCKRIAIRDVRVISAANGVNIDGPIGAVTDPLLHSQDVSLENVVVSAATNYAVTIAYANRVRVSGGNLIGTTKSLLMTYVSDFTVLGTGLPNGMSLGTATSPRVPLATALTMAGAWSAFGAPYVTPAVRRDANGFAHIEGSIKSGTLTSGTVITTLPAGFRPANRVRVGIIMASADSNNMDLFIEPNGQVALSATITSSVVIASFDGVTFPVAST